MKRIVFITAFITAFAMIAHGQVAIKTNVLMDAFRLPNLGAEIGLSKKTTLDASFFYNPWRFSHSKQLKLFLAQPEFRYWLCEKFNGHYFGAHLMGGVYNVMGFKPPFALWSDMKDFRYKGHLWGGGIAYGYQFVLGKHWNLGASIGFGYAYVTYKKYPCTSCPEMVDKSHKNYVGPTKLAVDLIYLF